MTDPLKQKYQEVDGTISELRQEAASKWTALNSAKTEYAEKGDATKGAEDPLFKTMTDADKEYGGLVDKITSAENVRNGLMEAMTRSGTSVPELKLDPVKEATAGRKSPGWRITDSDEYKTFVDSGVVHGSSAIGVKRFGEGMDREETKALITGASDTSAGALVQPDRLGYYPMMFRPLTVLDLITIGDTDSDLVEYVEQTSFTNAAAPVAEATDVTGSSGTKPQSITAFTKREVGVKTIAHWVAATRRALADAGQMRTIIDGLLRYGLDAVLEAQVVAGDGTGENLRGILNTTGLNAIPAGAQSNADKIHMGITQNLLDGFQSTGVLMNPLDWEEIRLSRENGSTGAYLFGSPAVAGPETLWGRPVALTPAIAANRALVGDFRAYILWMREGTQILASDSHADFFIRNLIAVLAELRAAGGMIYPQALADVNLAAS